MVKIFISYRRADSQHITDRLHDHLVNLFDEDSIFQDVDNIPFGVDFPEYLSNEVNKCDVVLVMIGKDWARIIQERANQSDDFVRIEVESALRLGKLVIPVLVKGATMPNALNLPESIRDLCRKNAAQVRPNPDFRRDCKRLADGIRQYAESVGLGKPSKPKTSDILPAPFDWIEIPGGRGTMKTNEKNVTLEIPTETYWIGKYPVTNAQFAKFIEAGGYTNQKWWTEEGWRYRNEGWHYDDGWKPSGTPWTRPRFWDDSKWNGADYPVVGVSWFEAVAYCQWLTEALVGTAFLPSGQKIMLPTEAQWQYAAQGTDGREYPWGNDFDKSRCNTSDSGIKKTTPVTQYAGKGDSSFGVVDMAGNVWEWCLTDYDNLTNDVNTKDTRQVLRGGSWSRNHSLARAASRLSLDLYARLSPSGFRLVCVRAPSL